MGLRQIKKIIDATRFTPKRMNAVQAEGTAVLPGLGFNNDNDNGNQNENEQ